ncbi:MAG: ABC transporter permease [Armatimonadetes bacterium]|nr:ABC transporter permease [Armatimonadota bacterium]
MWAYVVRKLIAAVPVLLGAALLAFLILHLSPGDPARLVAGEQAFEEDVEMIRRQLGLDRPFLVQYGRFLGSVLHGELGRSIRTGRSVRDEIGARFPYTMELAVTSLILSVAIGVVAGILAATRPNTAYDYGATLGALAGVSTPTFWLGLLLMLAFSYYLGWLPASGRGGPLWTWEGVQAMIMPAIALGTPSAAIIARLTRSSLLEVMRQDYVRTARSKGLIERVVINHHALRNALIPVVTVVGLRLGVLLGGAVITEQVFAWPGIGTLIVTAISSRDYPMVQGAILVVAFSFVTVNLGVDLLYALVDPRIRYEE